MTTYYVGPGGSDANNGTTWALRKLTLNGAEDIPVVAGDTVYVGPGVYRETLTVDVSGSGGSPITYIGDVTGQNTDGVGGVVRITGSDNDQTATRANAISITSKDYRTFRGLCFDTVTGDTINTATAVSYLIVEDCVFATSTTGTQAHVELNGTGTNCTIRRCIFLGRYTGVWCTHSSTVDNANILIEDCYFTAGRYGVRVTQIGGVTISNCVFYGLTEGVTLSTNPAAGQYAYCYNSIVFTCGTGFNAPVSSTQLVEDYNCVYGCSTARTNVATGSNSVAYSPLFLPPILYDGALLPPPPIGALSQWSQVRRIAGTAMATDDLYGITRPTTDSKKSWGAVQYQESARGTATTYDSSAASLRLDDAGEVQFYVPVTATSTVFSVYANRGTAYAGTAPQMAIIQPGQAGTVWTDTGGSAAWNQIVGTITPAGTPPYAIVALRSSNTATSGVYTVDFDNLTVA